MKNYEIIEDANTIKIYVPNQEWTKEIIKELKEKENIIFSTNSIHAIKIIERLNDNPLFIIGVEDDGCLFFDKKNGLKFDAYWTNSLVEILKEAYEYK